MGQSPALICEVLWWAGDRSGGLKVTKIWDYSKIISDPKTLFIYSFGVEGDGEGWG